MDKPLTVDEVLKAISEVGNAIVKLNADVATIASRMNQLEIRLQKLEDGQSRGKKS